MVIEINNDKHCSIHLLLSRLFVTRSVSVPSAKDNLFNSIIIIFKHFSLIFSSAGRYIDINGEAVELTEKLKNKAYETYEKYNNLLSIYKDVYFIYNDINQYNNFQLISYLKVY